jgi:hypothetical protein
MSAVGPAGGFLLGSLFLNMWVDPGKPRRGCPDALRLIPLGADRSPPPGMTTNSPLWVGAWYVPDSLARLAASRTAAVAAAATAALRIAHAVTRALHGAFTAAAAPPAQVGGFLRHRQHRGR